MLCSCLLSLHNCLLLPMQGTTDKTSRCIPSCNDTAVCYLLCSCLSLAMQLFVICYATVCHLLCSCLLFAMHLYVTTDIASRCIPSCNYAVVCYLLCSCLSLAMQLSVTCYAGYHRHSLVCKIPNLVCCSWVWFLSWYVQTFCSLDVRNGYLFTSSQTCLSFQERC